MDNADAALPAVTAAVDEPLYAHARVGRRQPVEVVAVSGGILSSFQFPDFLPVNARRRERVVSGVVVDIGRGRRRRRSDSWSVADAAARIRFQRHDVRHFELEGRGVGLIFFPGRRAGRHGGRWTLALGFLHVTIVLSHVAAETCAENTP